MLFIIIKFKEMEASKNEIIIKYRNKKGKIKIFGEKFVENNKNN